MNKLPKTH